MRRSAIFAAIGLLAAFPVTAQATVAARYETTPAGNAQFLADFAAEPGVVKLPDGLMYQVVKPADPKGTSPLGRQDIVTVTYTGWMIDGKVFDRSPADEPRAFATGALIAGWTEAMYKMKSGAEWLMVIPAALAYGAEGRPPLIPPNQTLIFKVKLEKVEYP